MGWGQTGRPGNPGTIRRPDRLRGACPCSQCRAAKLRGGIAVVREDVRVERIEVQGYGVQLVFSDGHERGIYPWAYLRDLIAL